MAPARDKKKAGMILAAARQKLRLPHNTNDPELAPADRTITLTGESGPDPIARLAEDIIANTSRDGSYPKVGSIEEDIALRIGDEASDIVRDIFDPSAPFNREAIEYARKEFERFEHVLDTSLKDTNPKDAIGSNKIPIHLWPQTATIAGALGLLDGMLKYGRANWREAGIRMSIYVDALCRHTFAMFEGEDVDPDSGLPHECHALACLAIIVDARAAGKLTDDRQYPGGYRKYLTEMTPHVARLKALHASKNPHHYTIQDVRNKE